MSLPLMAELVSAVLVAVVYDDCDVPWWMSRTIVFTPSALISGDVAVGSVRLVQEPEAGYAGRGDDGRCRFEHRTHERDRLCP